MALGFINQEQVQELRFLLRKFPEQYQIWEKWFDIILEQEAILSNLQSIYQHSDFSLQTKTEIANLCSESQILKERFQEYIHICFKRPASVGEEEIKHLIHESHQTNLRLKGKLSQIRLTKLY